MNKSATHQIPAPVGGWNARDALDRMSPEYALALDNLFPRENDVVTRDGYTSHCDTGESAQTIESIHALEVTTTCKMLATANGKLLDVTTSSVSTVGTGFSENLWNSVVFSGRIFLMNGTDAPQDWDGTTLTATAWTGSGLTIANLLKPTAFKNRIYAVEKDSLNLWYGGVDAVTGAMTKFDLAAVGRFGGVLLGSATISRDGGNGPDDLFCIFISTGEVLVYSGTDPSSWSIVNRYRMAPPLNPQSILEYQGDVICITREGYLSLAQLMAGAGTQPAISDMIRGEANRAARVYAANDGWNMCFYPSKQMLLFNVPRSTGSFDQHVMNTRTGAWCRFRKLPAACWVVCNNEIFFGSTDGVVYKFDDGENDNGAEIIVDGQLAWNFLNNGGSQKYFGLVRPIFTAQNAPPVAIGIACDFDPKILVSAFNFDPDDPVGVWDEAIWDQAVWGAADGVHSDWLVIGAVGYNMSLRIRFGTKERTRWQSSMIRYESGSGL